jgi:hypothetical protein
VKTIRWPLLLALLGASAAAGADVYRSRDAQGTVVYSDRPTENSEPVIVKPPTAGRPGNLLASKSATGNAQANANAPGDQNPAARKGAKGEKGEKDDLTPAEKEAERAKNCETARDRKTRYETSHRLFKPGPNGEREYLNSAQIDEARAQAAADVQTWCGG